MISLPDGWLHVLQKLPVGRPRQRHDTNGWELMRAYEKLFELQRRMAFAEKHRVVVYHLSRRLRQ